MYQWTEPYEDTYLQERIQQVMKVQRDLAAKGQVLISTYEQLWLPVLGNLPDTTYHGQERYSAPYGDFGPFDGNPFHGALTFTPKPGAQLPEALTGIQEWQAVSTNLDLNARTVTIQVEDTAITFTAINVNLKPHELLREINNGLVRARAGVYVWRIEPVESETDTVQHLYPDGQVPVLSNAHTRADVTGYALLEETPYQHTLVYVGLVAHKTSLESLWATLVRRRGGCSMRGVSVLSDGEIKMLAHPLPDFRIMHAGIICRKALPGGWEAQDDSAYALVFETDLPVEDALQKVTLKRLQETLPFPIPDDWGERLWEHGLDVGYIQRLETGGDCRSGVRIDLGKPWQDLVQNLLEQEVLKV